MATEHDLWKQLVREFRALHRRCNWNLTQAAGILDINGSTLHRYLSGGRGGKGPHNETLKSWARLADQVEIADLARRILRGRRVALCDFNYLHAALQLYTCGRQPGEQTLVASVANCSSDRLTNCAAYDLVDAFVNARWFGDVSEATLFGHRSIPRHPFGSFEFGVFEPQYGECVEEVLMAESGPEAAIGLAWLNGRKAEARKRTIASGLLQLGSRETSRLYDQLLGLAEARGTTLAIPRLPLVAATAAVEAYRLETALMEAADTYRLVREQDGALEATALHRIATQIYQLCHQNRDLTIARCMAAMDGLAEEDAAAHSKALQERIHVSERGLYLTGGLHFVLTPIDVAAFVNGHGSVLQALKSGEVMHRTVVGEEKEVPQHAIRRE